MTRAHLIAFFWTLGILAACSIPGRDLPEVDIASLDKLVHFVVFAGFGWLWMHALRAETPARTALVVVAGLVYAGLTDVYQGLLPFDRTPDPFDALANASGLLVAVLLYHLLRRKTLAET